MTRNFLDASNLAEVRTVTMRAFVVFRRSPSVKRVCLFVFCEGGGVFPYFNTLIKANYKNPNISERNGRRAKRTQNKLFYRVSN